MSDLRVPCVPEYWPDKRHFRGKEVHSADPNGWFFAVFRGRGPGVYTTMEQVNRCLRDFEGGVWAQASTWDGIIIKWKENCVHHHSHVIDLSPDSSPPSTPATQASSTLPDASDASFDTSDDSLLSSIGILPALPFIASTSPDPSPRPPQDVSARLDAATHAAEAAARRITALVTEAEAAVGRISLHAETTFSHLQNASSAVRLIGQQADQALEALADARRAAQCVLAGDRRMAEQLD
ncbi:hypothetical protein B0H14DRAFT_2579285 [Mycena olivaceomarginata]|nr:hypothetical protein B0H14DRAFT_2579285 [Mycena olivaceomarginata]